MRFHWQNLNEKPAGRMGSGLLHGRCWWKRGNWTSERRGGVDFSWNFTCTDLRKLNLSVIQSEDVGFHVGVMLPFFCLWLTVHSFPWVERVARWLLRGTARRWDDREISIGFHEGVVHWRLWADPDSWSSDRPKWRDGSWNVKDALLGKPVYSQRLLSEHQVVISFAERDYDAVVKLTEAQWVRSRWFTRRWLGATVEVARGVPTPGKGENSYDCGEDALYSLSCGETTVEGAIAAYVKSVLNSRRRHGGSVSWRPAEAVVEAAVTSGHG